MKKYEKYQLDWMKEHNHSLAELISELENHLNEFPDAYIGGRQVNLVDAFKDWQMDAGFGSEIFVCEKEYNENEGKEERQEEKQLVKVEAFVADWYKEHKNNFGEELMKWSTGNAEVSKNHLFKEWLDNPSNDPIETLFAMRQNGYEVEETDEPFTLEKVFKKALKEKSKIASDLNACIDNKGFESSYFTVLAYPYVYNQGKNVKIRFMVDTEVENAYNSGINIKIFTFCKDELIEGEDKAAKIAAEFEKEINAVAKELCINLY